MSKNPDIEFEILGETEKIKDNNQVWKELDKKLEERELFIITDKEGELLSNLVINMNDKEKVIYNKARNLLEGNERGEERGKNNNQETESNELIEAKRIRKISKIAKRLFQFEYQTKIKRATTFDKLRTAVDEFGAIETKKEKYDKKRLKGLIDLVEGGGINNLELAPEDLYFRKSLEKLSNKQEEKRYQQAS